VSIGVGIWVFLAALSAKACLGSREIASPDGLLVAHITQLNGTGCGESRIAIMDRTQRGLATVSYASVDGEHGLGVEQASWTPNSAFFVFSTSSSGGHEATHFPTLIYSRRSNAFAALEGLVDHLYVTQPELRTVAPEMVELIGHDDVVWRVNLGELLR